MAQRRDQTSGTSPFSSDFDGFGASATAVAEPEPSAAVPPPSLLTLDDIASSLDIDFEDDADLGNPPPPPPAARQAGGDTGARTRPGTPAPGAWQPQPIALPRDAVIPGPMSAAEAPPLWIHLDRPQPEADHSVPASVAYPIPAERFVPAAVSFPFPEDPFRRRAERSASASMSAPARDERPRDGAESGAGRPRPLFDPFAEDEAEQSATDTGDVDLDDILSSVPPPPPDPAADNDLPQAWRGQRLGVRPPRAIPFGGLDRMEEWFTPSPKVGVDKVEDWFSPNEDSLLDRPIRQDDWYQPPPEENGELSDSRIIDMFSDMDLEQIWDEKTHPSDHEEEEARPDEIPEPAGETADTADTADLDITEEPSAAIPDDGAEADESDKPATRVFPRRGLMADEPAKRTNSEIASLFDGIDESDFADDADPAEADGDARADRPESSSAIPDDVPDFAPEPALPDSLQAAGPESDALAPADDGLGEDDEAGKPKRRKVRVRRKVRKARPLVDQDGNELTGEASEPTETPDADSPSFDELTGNSAASDDLSGPGLDDIINASTPEAEATGEENADQSAEGEDGAETEPSGIDIGGYEDFAATSGRSAEYMPGNRAAAKRKKKEEEAAEAAEVAKQEAEAKAEEERKKQAGLTAVNPMDVFASMDDMAFGKDDGFDDEMKAALDDDAADIPPEADAPAVDIFDFRKTLREELPDSMVGRLIYRAKKIGKRLIPRKTIEKVVETVAWRQNWWFYCDVLAAVIASASVAVIISYYLWYRDTG